ncbi:MAG TPA: DUF192 domain-containing protein [Longimicrobiaceae bacterium]|nr:DUF192 domain-containing protein [Longimicrobiaceae bacterium]
MRAASPVALLLAAALAACGPGEPDAGTVDAPLLAFDTVALRVATEADTLPLRAELASTEEQRALGLMERSSLPAGAGMLFWYPEPQPGSAGFWMFRTRIPLDIAFLGPGGEILAIQAMEPCPSQDPRFCPSYPAGVEFRGALEVNRGYFQRHGIGTGDRVLLPDALAAPAGGP